MRKIIIIILILIALIFPFNAFAISFEGCDTSEVSRMKSLVSNVNLYYDYYMNGDIPLFSVTLTNIPKELYFIDSGTNKKYYYSDTNNGEITISGYEGNSGNYKFYLSKTECNYVLLGTKYYKFPSYNKYYNDPLCLGLENFSLCKKWADVRYSQEEFEKIIKEYKSENKKETHINVEYEKSLLNKIAEFYAQYYYYFLPVIILLCVGIIFADRNKNKFKL